MTPPAGAGIRLGLMAATDKSSPGANFGWLMAERGWRVLLGLAVNVAVARQGLAGPTLRVRLNATSPGLFQWNGNYAIASHLSGRLVGPDAPAKAGEIVVVYAVGLGRTNPDTNSGRVVSAAASIVALPQLLVTIAGNPVAAKDILYAGLAPGFAGLYQINLRMPQVLPPDPEIRISVAAQASAPRIRLAALPTVLAVD